MRRLIILMISICILSSCGISNSDTEYMQQVLNNRLGDYYANEKVLDIDNINKLDQINENDNIVVIKYTNNKNE